MVPRALASAVASYLEHIGQGFHPSAASPRHFVCRLRDRIEAIERRQRREAFLRVLKTCASHLVLEGDEPSDESSK